MARGRRGSSAAPAPSEAAAEPTPGSRYGLPGLTLYTEQIDTNQGAVQALAQGQATPFNGLLPFKQTDVVYFWEYEFVWTNTITPGTSAITTSPYFPFNIVSESFLKIQNMYATWHPLSGIDAYIWQIIRPMRPTDIRNEIDASPENILTTERISATTGAAQAQLNTPLALTSATAAIPFTLEVPASLVFDVYYDLSVDGRLLSQPHRAIVSPQYLAGSSRVIQPQLGLSAISAPGLDVAPFNIGAGTGTGAGSVSLTTRRVGVYSNNDPSTLPVVYNWQYLREASQVSLAGVSRKDIPLPEYGQILSVYIRLWDPAANGGLGAPISLSTVTKCQLQFGSALLRFDDTPKAAQRRFTKQKGFLPPEGVIIWDMAVDEWGRITNAGVLNTLTTAGVLVHLEFSGALSATAYAVLGVEALTFVA